MIIHVEYTYLTHLLGSISSGGYDAIEFKILFVTGVYLVDISH